MSVETNIYVGSFLEIKKKEIIEIGEYYGCPKCLREFRKDIENNYCIKCGTKLSFINKNKLIDFNIFTILNNDLTKVDKYVSLTSSWFNSNLQLVGFNIKNDFHTFLEIDEIVFEEQMPKKATEEDWGRNNQNFKRK